MPMPYNVPSVPNIRGTMSGNLLSFTIPSIDKIVQLMSGSADAGDKFANRMRQTSFMMPSQDYLKQWGVTTYATPEGGMQVDVDTSKLPQNLQQWVPLIKDVATNIGVPANWIAALMQIESGGNPNAVSPAGARGLMQVMPFNAKGANLMDPRQNVMTGAKILLNNYKQYGDWTKAAAAYFGAISPSGEITGARDVTGTSGHKYVAMAKSWADKFAGVMNTAAKIVGNYAFPVENYKGNIEPHWGQAKGAADLFAAAGTPVFSMAPGKVIQAGYSPIGGNFVEILGDDARKYYYAHMAERLVNAGQQVSPGLTIGKIGTTGNAAGTPPHLHLGVGSDILTGTGPTGGAGTNFDLLDFLRRMQGR